MKKTNHTPENARELRAFLHSKRKLTDDDICNALGVKPNTWRMAYINGEFSARWYSVLEHLAGRKLPRGYFTFVKEKDE